MTDSRLTWAAPLGLLALLGLAVAVFWPGLSGPFLFDDFATLPALGATGGVDNLAELVRYLRSGIAGPSGRPLALASFLLNDNGWPSQAFSFKYTSLMFHLLAGVLLLWLVWRLERDVFGTEPRRAYLTATLAAALWLLNPAFATTVFYVVQRMTILAALMVLAGLLGWVASRARLAVAPRRAVVGMSLAMALGTGMGVLAKENAIVMPLLVLVLEALLYRPQRERLGTLPRAWSLLFLWLPLLVVAGWFLLNAGRYGATYERIGITPLQRLLTEARVLFDYLHQLLVPQFAAGSIFHDGFAASRGLLTPVTTAPAVAGIAGLLLAAVLLRRRAPRLSVAIAFFFAGHSLESTLVPLELYFDHRNYLPALLLFWPLAALLAWPALPYRRLVLGGAVLYLLAFPLACHTRATVWGGDETALMLYWAERYPGSPRAQRMAAMAMTDEGRSDVAMQLLADSLQRHPEHLPTRLHLLLLQCSAGRADSALMDEAIRRAASDTIDFRGFEIQRRFVDTLGVGDCRGIDAAAALERFLAALLDNPHTQALPATRAQVLHLQGLAALNRGEPARARALFARALDSFALADLAMLQITRLADAGALEEALVHLQQVRGLIRPDSRSHGGLSGAELQAELDHFEALLREAQR